MDAQELYNLQEAYGEIYQQLDEASPRISRSMGRRATQYRKDQEQNDFMERMRQHQERMKNDPEYRANHERLSQTHSGNKKDQKESFDIFDAILSYLLDEGYAETPEAAEAIMVNMSEEWRDNIIEARVDVGKTDKEKANARWERGTGGPVMHHISRGFKTRKGSPSGGVDRLGKPEGIPLDKQRQKRAAQKDADNAAYNERQRVQTRGTWDRG